MGVKVSTAGYKVSSCAGPWIKQELQKADAQHLCVQFQTQSEMCVRLLMGFCFHGTELAEVVYPVKPRLKLSGYHHHSS